MCIINSMKKLLSPTIALFSYLALASSAFAQDPLIGCPAEPFAILCFTSDSVPGIIGAAITFIFVIAVIIALFYLLLGALKWIFSGGDKAAVEAARGTITAAIVGLVIVFLVFLVFTILLRFFGLGIDQITNIPQIQQQAPPIPTAAP